LPHMTRGNLDDLLCGPTSRGLIAAPFRDGRSRKLKDT
jgi:hypothetical protein